MNILILGGAGFVGNNLVRRCLLDKSNSITIVDCLEDCDRSTLDSLEEVLSSVNFIKGDIRDSSLMQKLVKDKDVIFNCAAQTSHPLSFKDPLLDVDINCRGSIVLLESVRKYNENALVVYTSSSTVVGRAVQEVIDERHPELPLDIYSANKGVAEKYYYIYNKAYNLNTLILRFANLYGPYGKGYPEFGFMNYFISLAYQDKEITIYGDGNQIRNVMYVEDAVDLMYNCIFHKEIFGDIYFAVSREHYSVKQIAQEIVSVFGRGRISFKEWPDLRRRIEVNNVIISGAKLYSKFGWRPRYNFREGLEKTKKTLQSKNIG